MDTTPVSLLERLRQPNAEAVWVRFVELYTPLLFHWARQRGLQESDAADLVQDVFALLVRKLPEFTYDPRKSFRSWLRTVTLNRWREIQRRRPVPVVADSDALAEVAAPDDDEAFWERQYREQLVRRVLQFMQSEFQPLTWKACWECIVADRPAPEVAAELGMTPGAVRAAKFRVVCRLRQELKGLLD
jgi:RNA polymerase sigma-70 factor (ECF subfamily)